MIKYDGMPKEEESVVHSEINELEMIGFIMQETNERDLTFNDVQAVLKAEREYLQAKGTLDEPE